VLAAANETEFQGAVTRDEHDVPLKPERGDPPTSYRTNIVSPFPFNSSPSEAQEVADSILRTFDMAKPGVPQKRLHTQAFLDRHLNEHAAIWDRNQALMRAVGM
jgi:hypothetical protein